MSFKDSLAKFFSDVNEKTAGWQDWLSGNTAGYKNFLKGVDNFNAEVDEVMATASKEIGKITSVMSTVADWASTYTDFVRMDDKIIDKYNKSKKDKEENSKQTEKIDDPLSQAIVKNLESTFSPLSNPLKTKLDKFAPEVAKDIFNKGSKKEILRSLFTREPDFVGNIYEIFLYIEDELEKTKGLCVRTKNLTIPTRQAETFNIDFMNRSIPKIDTSLNLNNTIDLTFTLDDELIIFKELTNHSGITYMPIKATEPNFYDTVEFLQDSAELTSGFAIENSSLFLEISAYPCNNVGDLKSILSKMDKSQNKSIKNITSLYGHPSFWMTFPNLKIKSLGEVNFDKNQAGPTTVSLSALFNPVFY